MTLEVWKRDPSREMGVYQYGDLRLGVRQWMSSVFTTEKGTPSTSLPHLEMVVKSRRR